jgi:REP element-mobilizing transposase RayT
MVPSQGANAMASTHLSLHYHLVFSTKNREPWIADSWIERLHDYLGGTVNGLGGFSQGVGGVADHVHLLVGLKATHCLADFMRELKKSASVWVHEEIAVPGFSWQEGYAAFTVSPTARVGVKRYISNQKEHHRKRPFRAELIELCLATDHDERYLD